MLATSLALALIFAPHEPPPVIGATTKPAEDLSAASQTVADITLVPFGQAFGSYENGSGHMLALLEDATGAPLWVLDAYVYESGVLDGDLLPLEYVTSPIVPGVELSVSGQVVFDGAGNGTFMAAIFQYGGGAIPVFPVGKIEGRILQPALGKFTPAISGASDLVASVDATRSMQAYGPQVSDSSIIVCPKGRAFGTDGLDQAGFGLGNLGASSATGAAGHQFDDSGTIYCPKGRFGEFGGGVQLDQNGLGVTSTSGLGLGQHGQYVPPIVPNDSISMGQAGASLASTGASDSTGSFGHQVRGDGVIVCPWSPCDVQSAGSMAQAGAGLSDDAATGGMIVCPWGPYVDGSGIDVQSVGSLAQAGAGLKGSGGMQSLGGPAVSGSSGNDSVLATAAGNLSNAQFDGGPKGPSHARVALRWWLND